VWCVQIKYIKRANEVRRRQGQASECQCDVRVCESLSGRVVCGQFYLLLGLAVCGCFQAFDWWLCPSVWLVATKLLVAKSARCCILFCTHLLCGLCGLDRVSRSSALLLLDCGHQSVSKQDTDSRFCSGSLLKKSCRALNSIAAQLSLDNFLYTWQTLKRRIKNARRLFELLCYSWDIQCRCTSLIQNNSKAPTSLSSRSPLWVRESNHRERRRKRSTLIVGPYALKRLPKSNDWWHSRSNKSCSASCWFYISEFFSWLTDNEIANKKQKRSIKIYLNVVRALISIYLDNCDSLRGPNIL
jgi:hypothetical protein